MRENVAEEKMGGALTTPHDWDRRQTVMKQVRGRSMNRPRTSRFRWVPYSVVGTSSMPRIEAWSGPSLRRPSTVLAEV